MRQRIYCSADRVMRPEDQKLLNSADRVMRQYIYIYIYLALNEGGSRGNIESQLRVRFELGHWNHLTITRASWSLDPVDH